MAEDFVIRIRPEIDRSDLQRFYQEQDAQASRAASGSSGSASGGGATYIPQLPIQATTTQSVPVQGDMQAVVQQQARLAALQQQQMQVQAKILSQPGPNAQQFQQEALRKLQSQIQNFDFLPRNKQVEISKAFNQAFERKVAEFTRALSNVRPQNLTTSFNQLANRELSALGIQGRATATTPAALAYQNQYKADPRVRQANERQIRAIEQQAKLAEESVRSQQVGLRTTGNSGIRGADIDKRIRDAHEREVRAIEAQARAVEDSAKKYVRSIQGNAGGQVPREEGYYGGRARRNNPPRRPAYEGPAGYIEDIEPEREPTSRYYGNPRRYTATGLTPSDLARVEREERARKRREVEEYEKRRRELAARQGRTPPPPIQGNSGGYVDRYTPILEDNPRYQDKGLTPSDLRRLEEQERVRKQKEYAAYLERVKNADRDAKNRREAEARRRREKEKQEREQGLQGDSGGYVPIVPLPPVPVVRPFGNKYPNPPYVPGTAKQEEEARRLADRLEREAVERERRSRATPVSRPRSVQQGSWPSTLPSGALNTPYIEGPNTTDSRYVRRNQVEPIVSRSFMNAVGFRPTNTEQGAYDDRILRAEADRIRRQQQIAARQFAASERQVSAASREVAFRNNLIKLIGADEIGDPRFDSQRQPLEYQNPSMSRLGSGFQSIAYTFNAGSGKDLVYRRRRQDMFGNSGAGDGYADNRERTSALLLAQTLPAYARKHMERLAAVLPGPYGSALSPVPITYRGTGQSFADYNSSSFPGSPTVDRKHLTDLQKTLSAMFQAGLGGDTGAHNLLYDKQKGFTVIDYWKQGSKTKTDADAAAKREVDRMVQSLALNLVGNPGGFTGRGLQGNAGGFTGRNISSPNFAAGAQGPRPVRPANIQAIVDNFARQVGLPTGSGRIPEADPFASLRQLAGMPRPQGVFDVQPSFPSFPVVDLFGRTLNRRMAGNSANSLEWWNQSEPLSKGDLLAKIDELMGRVEAGPTSSDQARFVTPNTGILSKVKGFLGTAARSVMGRNRLSSGAVRAWKTEESARFGHDRYGYKREGENTSMMERLWAYLYGGQLQATSEFPKFDERLMSSVGRLIGPEALINRSRAGRGAAANPEPDPYIFSKLGEGMQSVAYSFKNPLDASEDLVYRRVKPTADFAEQMGSMLGGPWADARQRTAALVRAQGIPGIEQLVGVLPGPRGMVESPIPITRRAPGKTVSAQLRAGLMNSVTQEQLDDLYQTYYQMAVKGIGGDNHTGNMMYDPQAGFTKLDFWPEEEAYSEEDARATADMNMEEFMMDMSMDGWKGPKGGPGLTQSVQPGFGMSRSFTAPGPPNNGKRWTRKNKGWKDSALIRRSIIGLLRRMPGLSGAASRLFAGGYAGTRGGSTGAPNSITGGSRRLSWWERALGSLGSDRFGSQASRRAAMSGMGITDGRQYAGDFGTSVPRSFSEPFDSGGLGAMFSSGRQFDARQTPGGGLQGNSGGYIRNTLSSYGFSPRSGSTEISEAVSRGEDKDDIVADLLDSMRMPSIEAARNWWQDTYGSGRAPGSIPAPPLDLIARDKAWYLDDKKEAMYMDMESEYAEPTASSVRLANEDFNLDLTQSQRNSILSRFDDAAYGGDKLFTYNLTGRSAFQQDSFMKFNVSEDDPSGLGVPEVATVAYSTLRSRDRGKNRGIAMYLDAFKQLYRDGVRYVSNDSGSVSADATRVWEKLVELGLGDLGVEGQGSEFSGFSGRQYIIDLEKLKDPDVAEKLKKYEEPAKYIEGERKKAERFRKLVDQRLKKLLESSPIDLKNISLEDLKSPGYGLANFTTEEMAGSVSARDKAFGRKPGATARDYARYRNTRTGSNGYNIYGVPWGRKIDEFEANISVEADDAAFKLYESILGKKLDEFRARRIEIEKELLELSKKGQENRRLDRGSLRGSRVSSRRKAGEPPSRGAALRARSDASFSIAAREFGLSSNPATRAELTASDRPRSDRTQEIANWFAKQIDKLQGNSGGFVGSAGTGAWGPPGQSQDDPLTPDQRTAANYLWNRFDGSQSSLTAQYNTPGLNKFNKDSFISFGQDSERKDVAAVNYSSLEPSLRGKGYGLAMYIDSLKRARENGIKYISNDMSYLSPYSANVWKTLENLGLATLVRQGNDNDGSTVSGRQYLIDTARFDDPEIAKNINSKLNPKALEWISSTNKKRAKFDQLVAQKVRRLLKNNLANYGNDRFSKLRAYNELQDQLDPDTGLNPVSLSQLFGRRTSAYSKSATDPTFDDSSLEYQSDMAAVKLTERLLAQMKNTASRGSGIPREFSMYSGYRRLRPSSGLQGNAGGYVSVDEMKKRREDAAAARAGARRQAAEEQNRPRENYGMGISSTSPTVTSGLPFDFVPQGRRNTTREYNLPLINTPNLGIIDGNFAQRLFGRERGGSIQERLDRQFDRSSARRSIESQLRTATSASNFDFEGLTPELSPYLGQKASSTFKTLFSSFPEILSVIEYVGTDENAVNRFKLPNDYLASKRGAAGMSMVYPAKSGENISGGLIQFIPDLFKQMNGGVNSAPSGIGSGPYKNDPVWGPIYRNLVRGPLGIMGHEFGHAVDYKARTNKNYLGELQKYLQDYYKTNNLKEIEQNSRLQLGDYPSRAFNNPGGNWDTFLAEVVAQSFGQVFSADPRLLKRLDVDPEFARGITKLTTKNATGRDITDSELDNIRKRLSVVGRSAGLRKGLGGTLAFNQDGRTLANLKRQNRRSRGMIQGNAGGFPGADFVGYAPSTSPPADLSGLSDEDLGIISRFYSQWIQGRKVQSIRKAFSSIWDKGNDPENGDPKGLEKRLNVSMIGSLLQEQPSSTVYRGVLLTQEEIDQIMEGGYIAGGKDPETGKRYTGAPDAVSGNIDVASSFALNEFKTAGDGVDAQGKPKIPVMLRMTGPNLPLTAAAQAYEAKTKRTWWQRYLSKDRIKMYGDADERLIAGRYITTGSSMQPLSSGIAQRLVDTPEKFAEAYRNTDSIRTIDLQADMSSPEYEKRFNIGDLIKRLFNFGVEPPTLEGYEKSLTDERAQGEARRAEQARRQAEKDALPEIKFTDEQRAELNALFGDAGGFVNSGIPLGPDGLGGAQSAMSSLPLIELPGIGVPDQTFARKLRPAKTPGASIAERLETQLKRSRARRKIEQQLVDVAGPGNFRFDKPGAQIPMSRAAKVLLSRFPEMLSTIGFIGTPDRLDSQFGGVYESMPEGAGGMAYPGGEYRSGKYVPSAISINPQAYDRERRVSEVMDDNSATKNRTYRRNVQ